VPAARDELQHANRRDVQLQRLRPARRAHRPPRRRLGDRLLRGARLAPLRRPPAGVAIAGGRADPALPHQEPSRGRAHPQGDAGRGGAGELPSVRARALGPLLGVRPQRRPEGLQAAPARQLPPGRQHRQRARVLLDHAGALEVARRRAERRRTDAHAARTGAADCPPWPLQLPAVQRRGAVVALRDQPVLRGAPASVRPCPAGRRGPLDRLRAPHFPAGPRRRGGDGPAHHQRGLDADAGRRAAGVRRRRGGARSL
ncbi:MAG: Putative glutamine amidotransferase YafJ, partial [uncultured Ramlibacter sp.]